MYLLWHPFGWDWRQWLGWQGKLWVRRPQTPDHTLRAYILSSQPRGGRMGPEIDQKIMTFCFRFYCIPCYFEMIKLTFVPTKKDIWRNESYWAYLLNLHIMKESWTMYLISMIIDYRHTTLNLLFLGQRRPSKSDILKKTRG